VTRQIVTALKINFDKARSAQATPAAPARIEAHDCFLRGRELMQTTNLSREGVRSAGEWFRRAVELDPTYPGGYGGLAQVYALQYQNQWGSNPADDLRQARRYVDEGLAQDPRDAYLHFQNALVSMFEKNYERWQSEVELALALNPNLALALNVRGFVHLYQGEPLKGLPFIEQAMRLDPAFRQHYLHFVAMAYFFAGQLEKAVEVFRERITLNPGTDLSRVYLASALAHLGRLDEAREVWRQLREINPAYAAATHLRRLALRAVDIEHVLDGLRKAGLPTD